MNNKQLLLLTLITYSHTVFYAKAALEVQEEKTFTQDPKTKCWMASETYLRSVHPLLRTYKIDKVSFHPAQGITRGKNHFGSYVSTIGSYVSTIGATPQPDAKKIVGCNFIRNSEAPDFPILMENTCDSELVTLTDHIRAIGIIATHPFFKEQEKVTSLENFLNDFYGVELNHNRQVGLYTSLQLPKAEKTYKEQYPSVIRNLKVTSTKQKLYLDELVKAGVLTESDTQNLKAIIDQGRDPEGNLLNTTKVEIITKSLSEN